MRERIATMIVVVTLLVGQFGSSSAARNLQQGWWKTLFSGGTTSSGVNNPSGSSVVFPLYGNVYPIGFYYVQANVGQPPRPYFVDPDTGSDLTWLQCDAPCVRCTEGPHPLYRPNNDLVSCRDSICESLHSPDYECENPRQCDYEVDYADGGSSLGVLLTDSMALNLTNGLLINPRLGIGCGYDQIPGASYHPLDGVLGLGRGKSSIVSQLHSQGLVRNVIGHCFSSRGGGFLFIGGDDVYDPSRIVWEPMSNHDQKHYSAGAAELLLGGRSTGLRNLMVIFDSGSSYSYLNSQAYQSLISLMRRDLQGKAVKETRDDRTLPVCWRGKKPFKTIRDARKFFKPLALSFSHGWRSRNLFEINPESYLIISSKGNACLGILNGTEVGLQNYNLIGDISMQDKMVVYDNEKRMIGWANNSCDRSPNSHIATM